MLEDHQPSVETAISANKNAIEPQAAAPIYKQGENNVWYRFGADVVGKGGLLNRKVWKFSVGKIESFGDVRKYH